MKRAWIVVTLLCLICAGALPAFGDDQKMDKETYQQQAEGTLKGLEQKMDEMKEKAADLKMDAKEKFDQEMMIMKEKKEAAERNLEKLKSATGEAWDNAKAETQKALEDLSAQYDKMMSRFKNR
ncbi:hypothetical protein [Geobacter sp.]|uniref:hypothetical protein n=1 Tax=Geobacter sp. TaxID=46610 RepID=UPI00260A474E|nr:hypothetical protein [Geobacter sp.]